MTEYTQPRFIRLRNGDDIISECVETSFKDVHSLQLINPLKVMYIPGNTVGTVHVGLAPWVVMSIPKEQTFTIDTNEILLNEDVSEKMSSHYWNSIEMLQNPPEEEQEELPPEECGETEEDIKDRTYH